MKAARPPVLLVLVVLAVHLLAGHEVLRIHQGWLNETPSPMPARMQVDFVNELKPAAPPRLEAAAPATGKPAPRPAARPQLAAAMSGPAASAAEPPKPAASAAQEPSREPAVVAEAEPAAAAPPTAPASVASAATAAAAEPSTEPDGEPGAEWPLSTRLSYVLTGNYRGPVAGQAQVEWLRQGRAYQVHLDVGIGPSFAPLITRRMSSQGQLTASGIAPQRYDEETRRILGEPRRFSQAFLGGMRPGQRHPMQDSVSQFIQLTWLFLTTRETLEPGRRVLLPLLLPSGPYDWEYEVVGEELLDTSMGQLPAWHLKPRQAARSGDLAAQVWLAPSLQFLPVRLLIHQDADTYIDLMLKSPPLQAAPESANGIPRRLSQ